MNRCSSFTIKHVVITLVIIFVLVTVLVLDFIYKGWPLLVAMIFASYGVVLGMREILRRYIKNHLLLKYGEVQHGVARHISGGGRYSPIFLHYVYSVNSVEAIHAKHATSLFRRIPEPDTPIDVLVLPRHHAISMPMLSYYMPWLWWIDKLYNNILLPLVMLLLVIASVALPVSVVLLWGKL